MTCGFYHHFMAEEAGSKSKVLACTLNLSAPQPSLLERKPALLQKPIQMI